MCKYMSSFPPQLWLSSRSCIWEHKCFLKSVKDRKWVLGCCSPNMDWSGSCKNKAWQRESGNWEQGADYFTSIFNDGMYIWVLLKIWRVLETQSAVKSKEYKWKSTFLRSAKFILKKKSSLSWAKALVSINDDETLLAWF